MLQWGKGVGEGGASVEELHVGGHWIPKEKSTKRQRTNKEKQSQPPTSITTTWPQTPLSAQLLTTPSTVSSYSLNLTSPSPSTTVFA